MKELKTKLGLPLHRQLTEILLNQIANGEYAVGDRLPTEEALSRQFDVSRVTVRQALKGLESDGLLARAPGRGTFLKSAPKRRGSNLIRQIVNIGELIAETRRKSWSLQRTGIRKPPARAGQALGLGLTDKAPYHVSVHYGEDVKWAVRRFYHPAIADHIDDTVLYAPDFDAALARNLGAEVVATRAWVEALLAEPHMVITLHEPVGMPLFSLWTVSENAGVPVAIAQFLMPGNRVGASFPLDKV